MFAEGREVDAVSVSAGGGVAFDGVATGGREADAAIGVGFAPKV